jgi:hypothetical protein
LKSAPKKVAAMAEWAPSMPAISRLEEAGYYQQFVRIDRAAALCQCSEAELLLSAREVQQGKFLVCASRVHFCDFALDGSRQFTHVAWMTADGEPEPPRPARLDDYGPRSKPLSIKRDRRPTKPYETEALRDRTGSTRPSRNDRQALLVPLSWLLFLLLLLFFVFFFFFFFFFFCCCFCCF